MFAIIGIVIVIGAILGGFIMEKGPLPVLIQPAESSSSVERLSALS